MSNLIHLKELLEKKYFTSLVEDSDYEKISSFDDHLDFSNYVLINKNLFNNERTYVFAMVGSPVFFSNFEKVDSSIFNRIHLYLKEFDSNNLDSPKSELFFFDSTVIENSYDEKQYVRNCIKGFFDYYYSYDEDYFNKSLEIFDGDLVNFIDAIRINYKDSYNALHCYEKEQNKKETTPDRNKEVLKKLLLLNEYPESLVDEALIKIEKLVKNNNIRLTYEIRNNKEEKQKELKIFLMPFYHETFNQTIFETIDNLHEVNLISEAQKNDLREWEDYTNRRLSHFSIDFKYENGSIFMEPVAHYGIYLTERFIVPIYRETYDEGFPEN